MNVLLYLTLGASLALATVPHDQICQGHTDSKHVGKPFAHPFFCSQFLTCSSDGHMYVSHCPAGTYYDIKLAACLESALATCGNRAH